MLSTVLKFGYSANFINTLLFEEYCSKLLDTVDSVGLNSNLVVWTDGAGHVLYAPRRLRWRPAVVHVGSGAVLEPRREVGVGLLLVRGNEATGALNNFEFVSSFVLIKFFDHVKNIESLTSHSS